MPGGPNLFEKEGGLPLFLQLPSRKIPANLPSASKGFSETQGLADSSVLYSVRASVSRCKAHAAEKRLLILRSNSAIR